MNSTIRKAAAPITGGMICPLTDEATSTAPAFSEVKPTRFISGMVKVPVVTTSIWPTLPQWRRSRPSTT